MNLNLFFIFHRAGKKPLERLDRTYFRSIDGGPNREELIIDGLRLGQTIPGLGVFFLEKYFKQKIRNVEVISVGRIYSDELWSVVFKVGKRSFSAFYSTKTRKGYVCDVENIVKQIWPNGKAYRPLTDYQLMGLLQMSFVANDFYFSRHVCIRIIQSIKGIKEHYSYDETDFHKEDPSVRSKIVFFKKEFEFKTGFPVIRTLSRFREILG